MLGGLNPRAQHRWEEPHRSRKAGVAVRVHSEWEEVNLMGETNDGEDQVRGFEGEMVGLKRKMGDFVDFTEEMVCSEGETRVFPGQQAIFVWKWHAATFSRRKLSCSRGPVTRSRGSS